MAGKDTFLAKYITTASFSLPVALLGVLDWLNYHAKLVKSTSLIKENTTYINIKGLLITTEKLNRLRVQIVTNVAVFSCQTRQSS